MESRNHSDIRSNHNVKNILAIECQRCSKDEKVWGCLIYIYIYIYLVAPPPGPTSEGGECITYQVWCWMHSKTCSENTVNFSVLCTSYWFCFDDRYSLIRENRKKNKTGFRFSFELCSLQNYTPSAGFVTYTSPKPAWEAKNALFCLECT